ncbi:MAG: hypothetical protein ACRD1J_13300 [Terriglobia bacterium]
MSDPKKPRNPAKAMFGFDDPAPAQPRQPGGGAAPAAGGSYGFGQQPPSVNFGAAPPSQTPSSSDAPTQATPPHGAAIHPEGGAPQYVYVQGPPAAPGGAVVRWLVIALLALGGVNLYLVIAWHGQSVSGFTRQADQMNLLTRRADSSDDRLAQLSAKFQVTAERLGLTRQELAHARALAANIEKQQQQSVKQLSAAISEKASAQQVNQLQTEANTKFGTLSGSIAGTQKDLEATKEALTGAKGELSGAIARTHDELVALAHRTDRDYFEFHLPRKGTRRRIGSLQVQLLKTNTKHNLFTVNLYFDDKVTQRRNEALDEPVFFYMQGAPSALELVVNKLEKNAIAGYVSAPKGFIVNAPNVLSARPNS